MPLVKLLCSFAGNGFYHEVGEVLEVDSDTAARYIERSLAEPVSEPETATLAPPLRATRKKPRKRPARKQKK
tara:strand:+ start:374 stop:589 length:216 start_codon:yes stop_codon:yes gene_type:complete